MTRAGLLLLIATVLAACGSMGGPGVSRNTPPGIDPRGEAVDPLLVGHRLMEAGEYELALKSYFGAAAEHGLNIDTLSAIGSANLRLGRLGQAEDVLQRALDEDPTFVPALNNMGVVLMEQGRVGEAKIYFERAYAQDSGQSDSIRENLKRAIAATESRVYSPEADSEDGFELVRREKGRYVLLTQL